MAKKLHKTKKKNESALAVSSKQEASATRGRIFEGTVTKKFPTRVVVEFERTVYIQKYQRFYKKKTRLHARLLNNMNINVGDYIRVRECRPLSKIIHFIVIEKVRSAEEKKEKEVKQEALE